jgi:hypothetical protein
VWVTEAELLLGAEFEREVRVGETTTDGLFTRDGHRFAVEVDNAGKQSRRQYREKWARLGRFDGFVLVLCHTAARMKSLVRWAESQKEVCLFNTFARLRAGQPWTDWTGATAEV